MWQQQQPIRQELPWGWGVLKEEVSRNNWISAAQDQDADTIESGSVHIVWEIEGKVANLLRLLWNHRRTLSALYRDLQLNGFNEMVILSKLNVHLSDSNIRARFNIKMTSYQYRKSHCGAKTIWRPSYLHNGISYTGKMTSLYWIRAQVPVNSSVNVFYDVCPSYQ